ncbi:MAG: G-D-S-L family lipolytic protein [Winogradskyella sp.]|uniref:G-D-S-L family lipolytic protein n=1 Tax=Winogradskyella sp. TaxID=1883156 RepID=UPI000F3DA2DE|nr:G-D-S-L family lipolytic protein [Winogradskyella sp.]RNC88387.1 MAG: G-D-S-L family lipolytic protein [Winogradskyella sp.]
MKKIKYILLTVLSVGFLACENETLDDLRDRVNQNDPELPALTSGSANFSNYVAVGPSFTAGFADGGLFIASQENSFPNIIASQFANAGGGTFTQPLMNDNFGGLALAGNRIADPRLVFGGAGPVPLESVIGPVTVSTDIALNNPTGPFNNLGVPGAKSFHIIAPGYGNIANVQAGLANPYAVRITGNTPDATILELAVAQSPTFFSLGVIGGNDVLGYATTGGDGSNPITDQGTFDFAMTTIINGLVATGAQGVLGNTPNVGNLPFFTTVPHNPLPIDAATAGFLNSASAYGAYNAGLDGVLAFLSAPANVGTLQFLFPAATAAESLALATAEMDRRKIFFMEADDNAVVIMDEDLTDLTSFNPALINMRQATADDLVVLPAASFIGTEAVPGNPATVNGVAIPLADNWILTPEEQEEIATATAGHNATLAALASANGLALVDLNAILEEASSVGIQFDDFNLNTDLVFGGLVSLDGIHLTARGYALMANRYLEAIDATYGSNFVESGNVAKANDFTTNYSPLLQ